MKFPSEKLNVCRYRATRGRNSHGAEKTAAESSRTPAERFIEPLRNFGTLTLPQTVNYIYYGVKPAAQRLGYAHRGVAARSGSGNPPSPHQRAQRRRVWGATSAAHRGAAISGTGR